MIPLSISAGSTATITNENLEALTNDAGNASNRVITFSVVRHPKLGRLVRRQQDNSTVDVSTFTQDMVGELLPPNDIKTKNCLI